MNNKPLFTSDELVLYQTVLFEYFHQETPVEKIGNRGCPANPIKMVDLELDYAVVHKIRENGKIMKVEMKIIYGLKQTEVVKNWRQIQVKSLILHM